MNYNLIDMLEDCLNKSTEKFLNIVFNYNNGNWINADNIKIDREKNIIQYESVGNKNRVTADLNNLVAFVERL